MEANRLGNRLLQSDLVVWLKANFDKIGLNLVCREFEFVDASAVRDEWLDEQETE